MPPASYRAIRSFMSAGKLTFGQAGWLFSSAAFAAAMSITPWSSRTCPTKVRPWSSKVPSRKGGACFSSAPPAATEEHQRSRVTGTPRVRRMARRLSRPWGRCSRIRQHFPIMAGLLSKERIVAGPRFNRWWNVAAALAINLSIGQAYAFSVFNLPLTRVLGVSEPLPEDWKLSAVGFVFTLAYVFLGLSAGVGGKWQDRVGPRVSGVVAAALFGSGFFLSALGVWRHQLALLHLGYGVLGGCGLGLGFNTPISTLLRWFPDRRGLATGLAVMGFGGGAILAAPLSTALMRQFSTATSVGVAETFVVLGALYSVAMLGGAFLFRLPPRASAPRASNRPRPASPWNGPSGRASSRCSGACCS